MHLVHIERGTKQIYVDKMGNIKKTKEKARKYQEAMKAYR